MTPVHTTLHVGLFAVVYIWLAYRVTGFRRSTRTSLGASDESDSPLNRAIRVHGNFSEYAPFALVLIAFAEMAGAHPIGVHVLCVSLLLGRLAHAYGITKIAGRSPFRYWGTASAFLIIVVAGVWASVLSAMKLFAD